MTNSSTINGVNGVANPILLTQWVKEDLGWDGMIVTDWADITSCTNVTGSPRPPQRGSQNGHQRGH